MRYLYTAASVLALSALQAAQGAQQQLCRALVLSGGANKGAYEAGVIHGLAHLLNETEVYWDVVSGVSAGALNGGGIATWPVEQPREMSEWLVGMWMNMTNERIYKLWPNGYLQGLFNETGLFNNEPLLDLVTDVLNKAGRIYKKIVVGSVDSNTGNYVTFSEADSTFEELPLRVVSSASIPFVFPHRVINNMTLMDGGTVWNLNLVSAIERCRELVDDDSKIVLDVISCARDFRSNANHTDNSMGNFLRFWDIKNYNAGMRNIYEVQMAFPKVQYRYFFQASAPLTSGIQEMQFVPEVLEPMIELGKKDAATVVGMGAGASFQKVNDWYVKHSSRQTQASLTSFLYN